MSNVTVVPAKVDQINVVCSEDKSDTLIISQCGGTKFSFRIGIEDVIVYAGDMQEIGNALIRMGNGQ